MYYFKDYVHRRVRDLIEAHDLRGTFLEVGCGRGENLEFLAGRGFSGLGIDVSPVALVDATKRLQHFRGISVRQETLYDVDGRFDLILALDVIEHLLDDRAALLHLRGLLRGADSYLILLVPAGPFMADDLSFGHFRRYERRDILGLLEGCGFRVKECMTLGYPFLHYARLISNRFANLPSDGLSPEELEANSLRSDCEHPMQRTVFGRLLDAVLKVPPAQALLSQLLKTQDLFSGHPAGHGYLVLAAPRP